MKKIELSPLSHHQRKRFFVPLGREQRIPSLAKRELNISESKEEEEEDSGSRSRINRYKGHQSLGIGLRQFLLESLSMHHAASICKMSHRKLRLLPNSLGSNLPVSSIHTACRPEAKKEPPEQQSF